MRAGFSWDSLKRLLARASTWTGIQTFTSLVATTADINGGTIDGTITGGTTPAAGTFTPVKSKGPAAITTFAGTVSTSGSSTTVTWSSAADAILAGYDATNPTLGTTIITGAIKQASVTRYVVSWTNSTACVVNSACTLAAATELTSVQLPIATFVDSAGVTHGWMNAAGNVYLVSGFIGNVGFGIPLAGYYQVEILGQASINDGGGANRTQLRFGIDGSAGFVDAFGYGSADGPKVLQLNPNAGNVTIGGLTSAGASAVKVLGMGSGTAPTTSPADAAQLWVQDTGAVAAKAGLHMRDEAGNNGPIAFATQKVITQASTDTLTLDEVMGTIISNYGQAAENTQTLPAAAAGLNGMVSISATGVGAFHLKAGASDKIYLNGTALDDGDKASLAAPAIGDCFSFWTIQTAAAAWDWVVVSGVGLLIDGGA